MVKTTKSNHSVFSPSVRRFFDILLVFNVALFLLAAGRFFAFPILLFLILSSNIFYVLSWFLLIRPIFTVVIESGKMSGPSLVFGRETILLRKVDIRRSLEFSRRAHFWGFRDIWSHEGVRIRLYRRILGKEKAREVIKIIKNYPFRESPPKAEKKTKTSV